jgi:PAS domain S-box-containing protein
MIRPLVRKLGRLGLRSWGPFLLLVLVLAIAGLAVLYATYSELSLEVPAREAYRATRLFVLAATLVFLVALALVLAMASRLRQAQSETQAQQRDLLQQRTEQLARLSEISRAFRSDQPLESVLGDIAHAIHQTLGFDVVLISVLQGDPPLLNRVAGAGIPLADMEQLKARPQSPEVVMELMQDRFRLGAQSYYIPHIDKGIWEDRLDTHPSPPQFAAQPDEPCWHVDDLCFSPLYNSEQQLIGIISVDNPRDGRVPVGQTMETLELFANQAAVAMQNVQLFKRAHRYANRLRLINEVGVEINSILNVDQLIARVSQLVQDNFGYDVNVALIERDYLVWPIRDDWQKAGHEEYQFDETSARQFGDRGIVGWAAESGQTVVVPGLARDPRYALGREQTGSQGAGMTRSEVAIPLKVQDQIIGVFDVQSRTAEAFGENDVLVLQSLANQTAVAIANAQLFEHVSRLGQELEQRVQERTEALAQTLEDLTFERDRVEALYQITSELSASLDLDRVLAEALSLINRAVGVSHGAIMLLNPGSGHLIYRAALGRSKGLPRGGKPTRFSRGVGLAGWVIETRESAIVPDVAHDPRWIPDEEDTTLERRSAMAVPLSTGEDVLGVLMLFHPEVDYFTADHLKLVSAAAAQVATAINNAELYQLITEQAERLGVMLRTQRAESAKHQAIVESIADGVLVLDVNRQVILMNPAAARILGLKVSAVEGKHVHEILGRAQAISDQELARQLYDKLMIGMAQFGSPEQSPEEPVPSLDFRLEAEQKVVVGKVSPALLGTGEFPSLVTVLRDISREAEVDRLKNEFISTVSHELRTPMTSIKGYSDLLFSDRVGPLSDQQRHFVGVIKNNADRLTALVNDILDISRIETGRLKLQIDSLDLMQLIGGVIDNFRGQIVEKSLDLTLDLPPSLPPVRGDKGRTTQILENLTSNAWKYTPEGGRVTIRARVIDGYVQVDVIDTGIGIDPKDIPHIFDRFYRTEQAEVQAVDGSGLGLSIVKMFVELLGGDIWVTSELNKGSTFSFTLPLSVPASVTLPEGDATGPKVLVVDDDEHILQLLRHQLEAEGYQVVTAQQGKDVFELARTQRPDLITLDVLLDDMDGFQVLEGLKRDASTSTIPVIIVSIVPDAETRGLSLGAAGYIGKPFEEEQVLGQVREVLSSLGMAANDQVHQVLVVDDDRHIVDWLRTSLMNSGFNVHGAYNGREALALVREVSPDLILLDVKMPDMDGYEVIRTLRQEHATRDIPVIIITGSPPDDDYEQVKILGMGVKHTLTKPFSIETLVEEIKRVGFSLEH